MRTLVGKESLEDNEEENISVGAEVGQILRFTGFRVGS